MKKLVIASLAAIAFASLGSALAQDSASHQLQVTIPEVLGIRILPTPAADVTTTSVVFDYAAAANQADYLAALATAGTVYLPPTSYSLGDIEVLAAGTDWSVSVTTSGTLANTGIDLGMVRITSSIHGAFTLGAGAGIATGSATTWTSLGISGADYELGVDGSELDGDDTITVTYTISAI
jgi:hypothetical protein